MRKKVELIGLMELWEFFGGRKAKIMVHAQYEHLNTSSPSLIKHTPESSTCPTIHTFTHTSPPSLRYRLRSPMKPGCVTQPDYAPLPHYPASPRVSGYPVQLWPAHTICSWIFHSARIMHVQSHMITAIIFRKTISALRGKLQSSVKLMEEKCLHLPRKGKMDIRI